MWIDEELHEHEFMCPYCWQPITMLLDMSLGSQSYVEDCEVCCNPIEVYYSVDREGFLQRFDAVKLGQ